MGKLFQESGGDALSRSTEAWNILYKLGLADRVEELRERDREFLENTMDRFEQYGERTFISPKQLFWLRDLKDRFL